jgi:membrane protein implicated in regulation of membrane protease activity
MKKADTIKTNVDSLIGKNAVVTKKIVPLEDGFVKVDGEIWLAYGDEVFGEGDIVKVESVSGTKLKVKK